MATGLRIIALTESEYQALLRRLENDLNSTEPTALEVRVLEHVTTAVYHPVPAKAHEVARTDQQQNIKRIRNR